VAAGEMSEPANRVTATFALFTYNQEAFVRDAVEAAFAQTHQPLEIILSDDCSHDRTFEIMEDMARNYDGPHKIVLNRNRNNIGLIAHVNKLFEMSSSEIVILAAGDDISFRERASTLYHCFEQNPLAECVHSPVFRIREGSDDSDIWEPPIISRPNDLLSNALSESLHIGASAAYKKSLFRKYGPITEKDAYEDLILGYRAMIDDSLAYAPTPLVLYRVDTGISRDNEPHPQRLRAVRIKSLDRTQAICRQRLSDLQCLDGRGHEPIIRVLESEACIASIRSLLYKGDILALIGACAKSPILGLRALLGEAKSVLVRKDKNRAQSSHASGA
jgi:glycosyltransferase involved in cell wall biosynthesis